MFPSNPIRRRYPPCGSVGVRFCQGGDLEWSFIRVSPNSAGLVQRLMIWLRPADVNADESTREVPGVKPRRYAALIGVSLVMVTLVGCANTTQPGEAQVQPSTQPKDRDAETKQVLRTVVAAARTAYVDGGSSFNDLTPASLAAVFEGVCYEEGYDQAGTCTEGSVIVQVAATKKFFGAAAMSPSDVCLWVRDDGISCDGVRTRSRVTLLGRGRARCFIGRLARVDRQASLVPRGHSFVRVWFVLH